MPGEEKGTILLSTANSVGEILQKKMGVQTGFYPSEWRDNINLLGKLEEKTASGAIASFSDGADDVPLKSGVFGIVPSGGGGTPSSPVPIVGRSGMTISHTGSNLLDISTVITGNLNVNTGNVDTSQTSWRTSDYIPCRDGDFTLSWESPQSSYYQGKWVAYDKDKVRIDGASVTAYTTYSKTFTFPSGTAFVKVGWAVTASGNPAPKENIRLNAGTSDLGYEPYTAPATHAVSFGSTVYGGEYSMDGGLKVTDKFVVYDGSDDETWVYNTSGGYNRFYIDLTDGLIPESGRDFVLSNRGEYGTQAGSEGLIFRYRTSTPSCRLYYYPPQTIDNVSDFRTWLSNNNLEVVYPLATPTETEIDPTPINSRLGSNNLWCDMGDCEVEYRSSGTVTIPPAKEVNIETVLSENPLIEVTGVSGTDVTRTMWTHTASADEKIVFHSGTKVKTNTGANDGYFTVKKNGVEVATTYANTSTTTALSVPDIDVVSGDVVEVVCGFDNYHTSAWFDLFSTITIVS